MQERDLYYKLELLTDKLHRIVDEKKGNLRDPGVLEVSQEMDRLIVSIQKSRLQLLKP
ncbi:Spo0E family sporulation regulatory protein-aspartic acid phosphatase [Gorillibacterium sp. sgz5001074]|uniref:Spo0E family sporulation regulatory protein-aspartic acid phosphatase n=1 Tax=Gorillibacterium sp. sgz5001074 TaxID=3446695 RepID=UPI003F67FC40